MSFSDRLTNTPVEIEGKLIGPDQPVFIIAEVGVNHNGELNLAKRTIEAAAKAGVDSVKFQSFRADEFMADPDHEYEYVSGGKVVREKMYEMFKRLELPLEWHRELFDYARFMGLIPLTSVADPLSVDIALEAGAKALKLASEDLINLPLLEYVAAKGLPILLSTGMADEIEIKDAIDLIDGFGNAGKTIFLHCVSLYPVKASEANLLRMLPIREITNSLVGYSDHTVGPEACIAAVALGACVLEKHFTTDKNLPGPDHAMSADPGELNELVRMVRRTEKMGGERSIKISQRELAIRKSFRRSIVASRKLPAGKVLERGDLALKRPGDGMKPRQLSKAIGKKLKFAVLANDQIKPDMLE